MTCTCQSETEWHSYRCIKLQKPVVNLNGATRSELIKEHMAAANAIHSARIIVGATRPHGRDYQTKPELYPVAREAFDKRMQMLRDMEQEFEDIAMALHQEGANERHR